MSTIVIKARVCLKSEERIDLELLGDAPREYDDKEKYVAWRKICVPIAITKEVKQYDKFKCMLVTYEGDILVNEKFESLQPRWSALMDKFEKQNKNLDNYEGEFEEDEEDEDKI